MSKHKSGGPISIRIDVNGNDNQPEWGWLADLARLADAKKSIDST